MLKLLLDERISPDVAEGLRRRNRGLLVHSMRAYREARSPAPTSIPLTCWGYASTEARSTSILWTASQTR